MRLLARRTRRDLTHVSSNKMTMSATERPKAHNYPVLPFGIVVVAVIVVVVIVAIGVVAVVEIVVVVKIEIF